MLAAYAEFAEAAQDSSGGKKVKTWTGTEISAKLEKLVANNKIFKNCNGVVELSQTGKSKYNKEENGNKAVVSD